MPLLRGYYVDKWRLNGFDRGSERKKFSTGHEFENRPLGYSDEFGIGV